VPNYIAGQHLGDIMKLCFFHVHFISPKVFTVYATDIMVGVTGNDCAGFLEQGFAWRSGNVDFYTVSDGDMDVDVFLNEEVQLPADTVRAIQVPFAVGPQGVGFYAPALYVDIFGTVPKKKFGTTPCHLPMPAGDYTLVFAHGFMPNWNEDGYFGEDGNDMSCCMWGKIWFNAATNTEPKVLVQDAGLAPTYPLKMDATSLY
jgi:Competence protein J (ComJ)